VGLGFVLGVSAVLPAQDAPATTETLVGNKTSKTFHRSTCPTLKRLPARSKVPFESVAEAKSKGYKSCSTCKPGEPSSAPEGGVADKDKPAPAKNDPARLKFSKDVAPILVANCIGCHNPQQKRGRFDLTTFQKLIGGSAKRKVIVPGNPDESPLILRIRGEEPPKMPPGQRNLSAEAIAKLEAWVKDGAILDAGIEPTAELAKVAPTPEMIRREALLKLTPEQRDKQAEEVGLERWKKASTKVTPKVSSDKHFLLFANIPEDRVKPLFKALDAQYQRIGQLLGPAAGPALGGPEKISLYVFNDRNGFVEFIRANENREVDADIEASANLAVETPYLAALDPLNGGEDHSAGAVSRKSSGRGKHEEEPGGPERSLAGLLAEQFGTAATAQSTGKPPRWLALGVGAYLSAQVEPRSPYYRHLRSEVAAIYNQGWSTKVQEALGGEAETLRVRAVGFCMMEWLANAARPAFSPFVRQVLETGGEGLDASIQGIFNGATRDEFLREWGGWVATHYGRGRG
jgi:mono/diheme cytochrome c family protein